MLHARLSTRAPTTAVLSTHTTARAMSTASTDNMFSKILIANRGEIACRVIRTARSMGIRTVAVYSDADKNAQHVQQADEAYRIGPALAAESYLRGDVILDVAKTYGAEAIHPGYGFLSENAGFARQCSDVGVEFIGPPASAIDAMGSKSESKKIMEAANVPVTPGYHGDDQSLDVLKAEAAKIGYPVMIKAVLGGGGKGMRIAHSESTFEEALETCKREAMASFSDDHVLLEKYVVKPRHVEFQVFADKHGNAVHLFERDCSVQRRHQKVLEESPAPGMTPELREAMGSSAVAAAQAVGYQNAGTVEFILTPDNQHYFMEMNTRLQVEHPVTELVSGVDLVSWQLKIAAGHPLPRAQHELQLTGHALEARIYAERPENNFMPATGKLLRHSPPKQSISVRVDSGITQGDSITTYYDPMIAKLLTYGENRADALVKMDRALEQYQVVGLPTNIAFLRDCVKHPRFKAGGVDTDFLETHEAEVLPEPAAAPSHIAAIASIGRMVLAQHAAAAASADADPFSPWTHTVAARPNGALTSSFSMTDAAGNAVTVALTEPEGGAQFGVDVTNDGADGVASLSVSAELLPAADGEEDSNPLMRFTFADRQVTARVVEHGDAVTVLPDGGFPLSTYTLDLPVADFSSAAAQGGAGAITTPMPGRVIRVMVKEGDEVEAGQTLMLLEAMKMEHAVKAASSGVVESLRFAEGDSVQDGDVLVTFEEQDA